MMPAMKYSPAAQTLMALGLVVVIGGLTATVLMLARAGIDWWHSPPPPSEIIEGWAAGADTFLMDVPADCAAQELTYSLWQIDPAQPASVEFVVSKMGDQVYTTGRQEFSDYITGITTLPLLDDSVYALNVRGINARWRFSIVCGQGQP